MDEIHDGGYNRECDMCLYDLHHCPLCDDVVGHAHFHEVVLTPEHIASIVQVIKEAHLEAS